jgi:hypothetical protein
VGGVSARFAAQVIDWLRGKGQGHLARINDILTNLMEAERRGGAGHGAPTFVVGGMNHPPMSGTPEQHSTG